MSSAMEKFTQAAEDTPILLLDVNLGNKVERLTLYSGDQNHLESVAKDFAIKHGLDEDN